MEYEFIISERLDGVGFITLNRPDKLNALSYDLVRELDDALTGLEEDDAIKAVIITGAGERAFSAGADIHEMADLSSEELAQRTGPARRDFLAHRQLCEAADRRDQRARLWRRGAVVVVARHPHRLREVAVPLPRGKLRAGQFDLVVADAVGWPKAKELLYHRPCRRRRGGGADRAVQQIVPSAKLRETAIEMGQMIAKNDPRMVQGLSACCTKAPGMSLRERYDFEDEARATWLLAGHPREGFKDFLARKGKR